MIHSITRPITVLFLLCLACGCGLHPSSSGVAGVYDVRTFGATGNGKTLDTPAVNEALKAAHDAGGGTVRFPAGTYLCFSIHLQSNVAIYLDQGATILAAESPKKDAPGPTYDSPEPNPFDPYEDFGHSHWHNSLIWGENLQNVSILGQGTIDGTGLVRGGGGDGYKMPKPPESATRPATEPTTGPASRPSRRSRRGSTTEPTTVPATMPSTRPSDMYPNPKDTLRAGIGNKSIALKLCRNVVLKDFTIRYGGHFGILATGVDNFTIDNLTIDTNRDGMDIDCCRNVHISNCSVNSPLDDGICLKSCFALGVNRPTENVTITNCQVSGYDVGTFLDGTYKVAPNWYSERSGPTGRIKFGTESNGGFKNITISNCVFDHCRGLALESVDGGPLEDVTVSNITMRHVSSSPLFLRLGARLRGPTAVTKITNFSRINLNNIVAYDCDPRFGSIISGMPGAMIEDVKLSNIMIYYRGGGTAETATSQPSERETDYPEPAMFGDMPAYGLYIRHVRGIELDNVKISLMGKDARPPFVLDNVGGASFRSVTADHAAGVPSFILNDVEDLLIHQCEGLKDHRFPFVEGGAIGSDGIDILR